MNGDISTCVHGLACLDGRCRCPCPEHPEFISSTRLCRSLIEGPCNSTENCIDYSYCNTDSGFGQCSCMPGYTNVDRRCKLEYGQKCEQLLSGSGCNSHALLRCGVQNICECKGFRIYDNKTETCVGLVGAR